MIPQFDWLCDVCGCVMSSTSSIYWVDLGFINNYKEPQLWLVLLRYSADVASAFPWVVSSSLSSCQTPFKSCSPTIQFFLRLWLAVAWKNFVFLSLHFNQRFLDLWFHIISSLTWISLISLLTLLISPTFPCKLSHNSSYWRFQHLINITKLHPIPSLKLFLASFDSTHYTIL